MKHLIAIVAVLASFNAAATTYDCKSEFRDGLVWVSGDTLFDDVQRTEAKLSGPNQYIGSDNAGELLYTIHGTNITVSGKYSSLEYTCTMEEDDI